MKDRLQNLIKEALKSFNLEYKDKSFILEHPTEISHGDYSSNVAMVLARELWVNPKELAEKIIDSIYGSNRDSKKYIKEIKTAGPGFINFYLNDEVFVDEVSEIISSGENYGKNNRLKDKKAMAEYTDPNPFKEFHIGHLMSNSIGEAISRLIEFSGAEIKRACYQGDVGLHVAKTIWGLLISKPELSISTLGQAYALGAKAYEENSEAKIEIEKINKKVYERSDEEINKLYDNGKTISLEHFGEIYKRLGTEFNFYFFESKTGEFGRQVVEEYLERGVFEKSEGAVIFKGEKYDSKLHTRVFINKEGLPTYEAKELGLASMKYDLYPYDLSVVVTGNEVNDYFKVLLKAMEIVFPDLAKRTKHISHGMLRLTTGKMSSRTGSVITGESLLSDIADMVRVKVASSEKQIENEEVLINDIAVAALKFSILKQAPGKDIIFDPEKSLSFEGDSGPYLQYSYARARSVLKKAKNEGIQTQNFSGPSSSFRSAEPLQNSEFGIQEVLMRILCRFPQVVERAAEEYAPHYILTYLTDLARTFNTYYAENKIVDKNDPASTYRIALTEAFSIVLKNGLYLLGIKAPDKM